MTDTRANEIRHGQAFNLAFQYALLSGSVTSVEDAVNLAEEALPTILEAINKMQAKVAFPGSTVEPSNVTPISGRGVDAIQPRAVDMQQPSGPSEVPGASMAPDEALWREVQNNPSGWWDNRKDKRNPKAPDFKRRSDGTALWLNSKTTPAWAKQLFGG